jgi:hypothetical protein
MKRCPDKKWTEWAKSVQTRIGQYPAWYGKSPMTVLADNSITYQARVLFGIIAAKTYKTRAKCNTVAITARGLGVLLEQSPQTICNWLKELEKRGHIEKLSKSRAKSVYRLTSPVFKYRVHVEAAPNAVAEVDSARLAILRDKKRRCPKCRQMARITSTSGACDACVKDWADRAAC